MEKNRLSDAEFEVMKVLWTLKPPLSSSQIISALNDSKDWKPQTILTLLTRLINKSYVTSKKIDNKNFYTPLVNEEDYLEFETSKFINKFHDNSLVGFVNTLYKGNDISKEELDQLKDWLDNFGK